jgi:hypothetical protein
VVPSAKVAVKLKADPGGSLLKSPNRRLKYASAPSVAASANGEPVALTAVSLGLARAR